MCSLRQARDAELLIAVTESDEVNMVARQLAYHLFNTPMRIARIRRRVFADRETGLYAPDHLYRSYYFTRNRG